MTFDCLIFLWFLLQRNFTIDAFTAVQNQTVQNQTDSEQIFLNFNVCNDKSVCEFNSTGSIGHLQISSIITTNETSSLRSIENYKQHITTNFSASKLSTSKCRGLESADGLTQTQLINRLTAPCRYDRLERPNNVLENGESGIIEVYARTFIYAMQNLASSDLQLKMHGLLQLRYIDPRLAFGKYSTHRTQPILGGAQLRELIWVPHLFLANEHESSVLGTDEKDILVSISPDGTIVISSRIKAVLFCWMDLMKFPFDEQYCSTLFESWMYNSSELVLHWEKDLPINFDPKLHLTEYELLNAWCNESTVISDENDMRHGAFIGSYSSLNFTVYIVRESGYYIMDYFLPSLMIVAISWVSFWLQADQTPARTTLGTSTMLSFITLASSQDKNLPKVSYIKLSEIWFLGCTLFIFSSLVEFAFVNTIWRRNRNLELKKVNSKHILKSTLSSRPGRHKSNLNRSNYPSSSNSLDVSIIDGFENITTNENTRTNQTWSTMTPQEVSLWIDRKSRFVFPLAFLIFNVIFWLLVYLL